MYHTPKDPGAYCTGNDNMSTTTINDLTRTTSFPYQRTPHEQRTKFTQLTYHLTSAASNINRRKSWFHAKDISPSDRENCRWSLARLLLSWWDGIHVDPLFVSVLLNNNNNNNSDYYKHLSFSRWSRIDFTMRITWVMSGRRFGGCWNSLQILEIESGFLGVSSLNFDYLTVGYSKYITILKLFLEVSLGPPITDLIRFTLASSAANLN